MDLKEVGFEDVDWFEIYQDGNRRWALVKTVMNLRVS
jgi:hypothetical protein